MASDDEKEALEAARALLAVLDDGVEQGFAPHMLREIRRRFEHDTDLTDRLTLRLASLRAALDELEFPDRADAARAVVVEDQADEEDVEHPSIEQFFESIAHGLGQAQRSLDVESERYLEAIANKPYLPPSVFRLPKLKASINFAMSNITSKGFDMLLFSRRQEHQERQEQSIEFEIVSAPPSVDALRSLADLAVQVRVVLLGTEADQVRAVLDAWAGQQHVGPSEHARALLDRMANERSRVIVFRASHDEAAYLLVHYGLPVPDGADKHLRLWRLTADESPRLDVLLSRQGANDDALIQALEPAFARQREILDRQRRLIAAMRPDAT